jgi:hypothetical protein
MSMKNPQFAVESEWRLAAKWEPNNAALSERRYRATSFGIVPHLAAKPTEGLLPISGVTLGPCNRPEVQRRTIKEFLSQHRFSEIRVSSSDLPIRT